MLSQDNTLKQKARTAFLQEQVFVLNVRDLSGFSVREAKIYLQDGSGAVRAYVTADFRCLDELLDYRLLSAPEEIRLGDKPVPGRKFLMPSLTLDLALEWLDQALGLENGVPALPLIQNIHKEKQKESLDTEYLTDLTARAAAGKLSPVIGRDDEMDLLMVTLQKKEKANPLLVGEPGVGKTAIVEGLAQRIVSGAVPDSFSIESVLELSLLNLLAGASVMGEPERRTKAVLEMLKGDTSIVVFMDEIHTLMNVKGTLPLADYIKPLIAKGELRIIGATTSREYRSIEADGALARRFVKMVIEEPSMEVTKEILLGVKPSFESYHGVSVDDSLTEDILHLSYRHLPHRRFPDKAIELLDLGCAVCRTRGMEKVEKECVLEAAEKISGIPAYELGKDEAARLLELDSFMKDRIIGQDDAIATLCNALRAKRVGIYGKDKPVGLLFTGPTGVGKTETARLLAEFLFGSPDSLIRLDMSEYRERHTVARLVGAPPGYVGYEEGGQLAEAVKQKPFCVVLFDEIEKGHTDVANVLLQILDDGRLTDSSGVKVNFKAAIVILTSNITCAELRTFFRPELLGRLRMVPFRALTEDDMLAIARKDLEDLRVALRDERQLDLEYQDDVLSYLAQSGLNGSYGVRELKRTIESEIIQPLSYLLLKGEIHSVSLGIEDGGIILERGAVV